MNKYKVNKKIAQVLGWTKVQIIGAPRIPTDDGGYTQTTSMLLAPDGSIQQIPDFWDDLNAAMLLTKPIIEKYKSTDVPFRIDWCDNRWSVEAGHTTDHYDCSGRAVFEQEDSVLSHAICFVFLEMNDIGLAQFED